MRAYRPSQYGPEEERDTRTIERRIAAYTRRAVAGLPLFDAEVREFTSERREPQPAGAATACGHTAA